ncbi:putative YccA/Bax inhibitor family protein [Actinocorallia herbida]|uniref:Putative YccA/Bax inhibitor family protein n=1 Tax=Actinocorallia herbida TaxID=58109 RepID=A0A3N1CN73_9ACTN|nr:Bax inhibitor-1/YccA family protein [Actinocorallia herbida]ROO82770.1 putative YccA/Bax inhibitor family protein [Actinocorallia herbida]
MESRNPVFRKVGEQARMGHTPTPAELQGMYDQPAYAPPAERAMTIDDVVVKGFASLGVLAVTGTVAWVLNLNMGIALVAVLAAFGIGLYLSFSGKSSAALTLTYSALYGIAVGAISHLYNDLYNGIVFQAILGTALAFGAVLTVYALRIIRVTPKFTRFVVAAGFGLVALMLVNLVVGLFNDTGIGIREYGFLGIAFSVVAILVGCFFLMLDFDMIERGVQQQLPAKYAWACAFALTSTLVWIYLEILRLLAILQGND